MLIAILLLLYALGVSYIAGHACICFIRRIMHIESRAYPITTLLNIIGLAGLSIIVSIYHFFSAIDAYLHAGILLCLAGYISFNRIDFLSDIKAFGKHIRENKWLALSLVIVAAISIISRPGTGDIADYHLQAIKWAEHFPNVIGLGNYNRPLANNNWWFNLQAFFGLSFLGIPSVYVLNALLFVCVSYFILTDICKHVLLLPVKVILLLFVAVSVKTAFIGSVTPDYAITLLIFTCSWIWLNNALSAEKENIYIPHILLICCCFAITIKLNAIVLALLACTSITHVYRTTGIQKLIVYLSILGSLFFIPWIVGNIIVSGWVIYPVSFIDALHVDWKIPKSVLEYERFSIKQWGKVPFQDIYVTANMSFGEWFPLWCKFLDLFNASLLILIAITSLIIPYTVLKRFREFKSLLLLWTICFAGVLFCFSNGPHIRYAFGYMVVMLGIQTTLLANTSKITSLIARIPLKGIYITIIIGISCLILFKMVKEKQLTDSMITPLPYTVIKKDKACWDQFPCTPYMIKGCTPRGESLKDGFVIKP